MSLRCLRDLELPRAISRTGRDGRVLLSILVNSRGSERNARLTTRFVVEQFGEGEQLNGAVEHADSQQRAAGSEGKGRRRSIKQLRTLGRVGDNSESLGLPDIPETNRVIRADI